MAASTIPQSDDVALAEIRELSYRLGGETPGRNQIMKEFGWGATRSTRLLGLYKDQTDADQSPGPVQPTSPPVQVGQSAQASPKDPVQSEQSPGPAHTDQSDARPAVQTDLPVQSKRPVQTANDTQATSADRTAPVQSSTQSAPAPVQPQEEPAPDQQTGPAGRVAAEQAGPAGQASETGQSWEHIQATIDRSDWQTATLTQSDQATEEQTAGPDRPPYGLILATIVISLSAFTAVWGGWVGLGRMVGFGPVNLLPGIGSGLTVDLAITLPLGIEAYAAAALWVAVGGLVRGKGRWFAGLSAGVALGLGAFGQATYHLLEVQGIHVAPDWVIVFVSILPVIVLGAAGVLLHLVLEERKKR